MNHKFKLEQNDGSCLQFEEFNANLTFKCLELESFKFRLFTGRLDRNGKEIYEGDKVRIAGKEYIINYDPKYMSFVFAYNNGSLSIRDFNPNELDRMELVQ